MFTLIDTLVGLCKRWRLSLVPVLVMTSLFYEIKQAQNAKVQHNVIEATSACFRSDIDVSVDFMLLENGTSGIFLGARVSKGGCETMYSNGVFAWVLAQKTKKGTTYNLVITGNFSEYATICLILFIKALYIDGICKASKLSTLQTVLDINSIGWSPPMVRYFRDVHHLMFCGNLRSYFRGSFPFMGKTFTKLIGPLQRKWFLQQVDLWY